MGDRRRKRMRTLPRREGGPGAGLLPAELSENLPLLAGEEVNFRKLR